MTSRVDKVGSVCLINIIRSFFYPLNSYSPMISFFITRYSQLYFVIHESLLLLYIIWWPREKLYESRSFIPFITNFVFRLEFVLRWFREKCRKRYTKGYRLKCRKGYSHNLILSLLFQLQLSSCVDLFPLLPFTLHLPFTLPLTQP